MCVRLAEQGQSLREIAKAVGRSHEWVRSALKLAGIDSRGHSGRPANDILRVQAIELLEEGLTVAEIAEELGVPYGGAHNAVYYERKVHAK